MATDSPGRLLSSPPKGVPIEEELSYWKTQYEQVELELQEFQNSSKELEVELERDIEESEKRERILREKAEQLKFEVDEWKSKYTQSKAEGNNAHNSLQKEITSLRDTNRTLQLKVRDIEVQNDDFERQTRNQTSSLEDLEAKHNSAVEKAVILEEDVKLGEQERENLRIDNQHLRQELSDLRVELEVIQGKLRHSEDTLERERSRKITPILTEPRRPRSPESQGSASTAATGMSSPFIVTPPPSKSETSTLETTPPSPPKSNKSRGVNGVARPTKKPVAPMTPVPSKVRSGMATATPRMSGIRPPSLSASVSKHGRAPSTQITGMTPARVPATPRPGGIPRRSLAGTDRNVSGTSSTSGATTSRSLHQIRGLIGKMQKLEERVHTARSKLPGPSALPGRSPPRASPRSNSEFPAHLPSNVTVRSARKRTSAASTSTSKSSLAGDRDLGRSTTTRLSYGYNPVGPKPGSSALDNTPSRPSSRTSISNLSGVNRTSTLFARPSSRASVTSNQHTNGRTTPLFGGEISRPRSSISGSYSGMHGIQESPRCVTPGPRTHRQSNHSVNLGTGGMHGTSLFSRSVSAATSESNSRMGSMYGDDNDTTPTALHNMAGRKSGIPLPGASTPMGGIPTPTARRQSGATASRRQSGAERPPSSRGGGVSELTGIGETF